jgi:hypothetical protein
LAQPGEGGGVLQGVLRRPAAANTRRNLKVKNLKKAAALTMVAGGIVAAGAGVASAHGADAHGKAVGSPGIGSGNLVQAPVHVPVNVSGNTVNVIGLLNPAFANGAVNH